MDTILLETASWSEGFRLAHDTRSPAIQKYRMPLGSIFSTTGLRYRRWLKQVNCMPAIFSNLHPGTFTFNIVPCGSPNFRTRLASKKAKWPATEYRHWGRSSNETAMEGMPWSMPSMAPATVPELVTSSPKFHPLLIPDTTNFGGQVCRRLQSAKEIGRAHV